MTSLLIRLFVKDSEQIISSKVRGRYLRLGGFVGIFCNLFLFVTKLTMGIISGSVAVTADAFNNLSDTGSALVTLLGYKMASKPADREHPFGHGRIEYMSGFIVACLIIVMGAEMLNESVVQIRNPGEVHLSALTICILIGSVLVKLWLGLFIRKIGRIIQSTALTATAADNLLDVLSTTLVLAATFISELTGLPLDGWVGAAVSLFIIISAVRTARVTLNPLLGEAPGRDTVTRLEQLVLSYEGIIGVHDVVIHAYGPGRIFASLHVEVPADSNLVEIHDLVDRCERDVRRKMGFELVIHMDPVEIHNTISHQTRERTLAALKELHEDFSMHDFRIVELGDTMTLFFDVVVPDSVKEDDDALTAQIASHISKEIPGSCCVIRLDRHYNQQK